MTKSMSPHIRIGKIDEFRPAIQNANKHTARGLRELEKSMNQDGYVAALTVAADGEALDGSARLEKSAEVFGDEVLVVEHDGKKPVVLVRTDIPNAQADVAKRIAIRANRIAELDLDWDVQELIETGQQIDLGALWTADEWKNLIGTELEKEAEQERSEQKHEESDSANEITCPHCGYKFSPR